MRAPFVRKRLRGASLSTVIPASTSPDYSTELASIAARIIYKSPLPSSNDLPIYILNSAAFPDSKEVSYDRLLPYVLARLPGEDELIGGKGYEVVFFAGGSEERSDADKKKNKPSITWIIQAYNVLGRAMRKRLAKLYLVHERRWVRAVTEIFSTIASPKFRRKVVHVSTLSQLALQVPIEDLLIPPSAYYRDRKLESQIYAPYATGRRAFHISTPFPKSSDGSIRLPRVLRETTAFLLAEQNIKTEGLFRVNARAITLEVLKEAYDRGQKFILWREGSFVMNFHQWKEGYGDVMIQETDELDGYPVFAAAGLVKMWYSDLKTPVFPESSYQYLERNFAGSDLGTSHDNIVDLIGADSDWSQITSTNRQILRLHLLPMLSIISQHSENKMSPKALAVCFAPSLLCGSDPVRDARMCAIVSKIIEYAIDQWSQGLADRFGVHSEDFTNLLTLPSNPQDREDPIEKDSTKSTTFSDGSDSQIQGITLIDNNSSASSDEEDHFMESEGEDQHPGPPLPPRTSVDANVSEGHVQDNPPRYSTIMGPSTQPAQQPLSVMTNPSQAPSNTVHRKPTPAQSRSATNESIASTFSSTNPENLPIDGLSLESHHRTEAIEDAFTAHQAAISTGPSPASQQTSPISPRTRSGTGAGTNNTLSSSSSVIRKPVPEH